MIRDAFFRSFFIPKHPSKAMFDDFVTSRIIRVEHIKEFAWVFNVRLTYVDKRELYKIAQKRKQTTIRFQERVREELS